ncbi:MAG: hypothetical protein L0H93_23230, partial [Nocardioides sp.]|nr:hypothetical protein [Nocardioides sp.]
MTEAVASLRLLVRTAFTLSPRHSAASFLEVCGVVLQRLSPIWVAWLSLAPRPGTVLMSRS